MPVLLCGACGCGSGAPTTLDVPVAYNNLRNLSLAYSQATSDLNRPPRSAEEAKPYLTKLNDPKDWKELLNSPSDGTPLVIQWGVDLKSMKTPEGKWIIWAYEANPHNGKRWVLQERRPAEMTADDFQNAPFAPGMKKPF